MEPVTRVTGTTPLLLHAGVVLGPAWWGRRPEMRQWGSALVILLVVVLMAAFTMSSIVAVVTASVVLQQRVVAAEDLALVDSDAECDRLDVQPCLSLAAGVSAGTLSLSGMPASSYEMMAAVVSPTEAGGTATNVDP
jgi:hypothetical protein